MTRNQAETHAETHAEKAVRYSDEAERLSRALLDVPLNSERARRLNSRLGVALKLAGVYAHLAPTAPPVVNVAPPRVTVQGLPVAGTDGAYL